MNNPTELYTLWLDKTKNDPDLQAELAAIAGDAGAIDDRFFRDLAFGTGGLRGVIGAGTNRMNIYTVARATQGFAQYLQASSPSPSVAIAYDSRNKSVDFARATAAVMAGNGIQVYLYPELMPTPMLSFAVRRLGCVGGVVVTASHNPAKYNGYKAYGPDGCQLNLTASEAVIDIIRSVDTFSGVKQVDFDKAVQSGAIRMIDDETVEAFLTAVASAAIYPELLKSTDLSVLYTPLNGAGNKPVRMILSRMGLKNVAVVASQERPDGNFPTAPYPNPEIREAFAEALKQAEQQPVDLLLATDPDADRVGIAVRTNDGYTLVSGNEVGALLLHYILSGRKRLGTLPARPLCVKTIVTTDLCCKIAADFGAELIDVLTGFKFIGEVITGLEQAGEQDRYVFGFEESYGYLAGTHVRDKDAVVSAMLICEMAAYYKQNGQTLVDALTALYEQYGYFVQTQLNFTCEGAEGIARMNEIMSSLRNQAPAAIGGRPVVLVSDYERSQATRLPDGQVTAITLPKSNVLSFALEGGAKLIVRPSGTEPKIKVYISVSESTDEQSQALAETLAGEISGTMGF